MMRLDAAIKVYLERLSQQGLLRTREYVTQEKALHFDCNDYLSLRQDTRIKEAYAQGYKHYPSGSAASMLLSGYHANHHELEQAFAALLDVDACILFSSGYAANLAVTALLRALDAFCLIDKAVHASIYDGLILSSVPYRRFIHNNMDDLVKKVETYKQASLIMTEGIFSMSGQIAPLRTMGLLQLPLIVDEAHSFGVLGKQGRGSISLHQLSQKEVPLRVIPLGKTCAAQGAIVAGQRDWIVALMQAGRSLIYSTAPSPALSYGLRKTLEIVVHEEKRREKLQQLISFFREQVKNSFLDWEDSSSMIQQLRLACPHKTLHYARELKKYGIYCSAIRVPTVSAKMTGLRVVLNYQHQPEHIQQLFKSVHSIHEYSYS